MPPRARQRVRKRPLGRGRWRLVLLLGGLTLAAVLYYRPVHAYLQTQTGLSQRSAEVRRLENEKQTLERQLAAGTSGATLLRQARRLGLVKPGEQLFIVKGIEAWRRAQARLHAR